MSKLPLTIAVSRYDHVNDVLTVDPPLRDIFFRFIHFKDFDVAELSMAKYVSMISQGDDSLIAHNEVAGGTTGGGINNSGTMALIRSRIVANRAEFFSRLITLCTSTMK